MLKPKSRNGRFWYPLHAHPLGRVLKFEKLQGYLTEIPNGEVTLDYGSGDRPYEELLLTKFKTYIAADYAVTNLHHQRRPTLYINNQGVPLDDSTVDCVVLTEVLEHTYEPKRVLSELNRLLRPGGYVVGSVPFVVGEHEVPYDFHRYTYYCLRKMLEEMSFEVVHLDYVGDAIAVIISTTSAMLTAVPKGLKRARMRWLGTAAEYIFKTPEFLYVLGCRTVLNPQRWSRCRALPLGFTFLARKVPFEKSKAGAV